MIAHFFKPFFPDYQTWNLAQWFELSLTSALAYQKNCLSLWEILLRCWLWWMNFGF